MPVEKIQSPDVMSLFDAFEWPESVPQVPMEDLTPEQQKIVLDAYRFSGYRPGIYQGITSDRGVE
jgi:hypothetical protein